MAAMTNYLADKVLNHTLRNTAYTAPAAVYLALFTADPTRAGTQTNEVSGGSYARTAVTFGAPADSGSAEEVKNTIVNFPTPTADWGVVTHWGIMDATTAGNMLYHGALTSSKTIQNGDPVSAAANSVTVDLL